MKKQFLNIKPYKLASHKIWGVSKEKRKDILKLDWNEATIPPTPLVGERILEVVNDNIFNFYPATYNQKLLKALSEYSEIPIENIQYFASSDSLHEYIAQMYIDDGDNVVILWPSYDNFRVTAEINGAKIDYYRYSEEFEFDIEQFEQFIKFKKPVLVYICNPNNPTGYLHSYDDIERLVSQNENVMFLIDEAYVEFSGKTVKNLVLKYDNIIISRTMSKAFALANFRFGYMIASSKNVENINTIRNAKNISTISQTAVEAALEDVEYMRNYVSAVTVARKKFLDDIKNNSLFRAYDGYGNFVLLKFYKYEDKRYVISELEKDNIYVRDLSQDELVINCIRITVGTVKQMEILSDKLNCLARR